MTREGKGSIDRQMLPGWQSQGAANQERPAGYEANWCGEIYNPPQQTSNVVQGTVIECMAPTVILPTETKRREESHLEKEDQQRREQTRIRQLEGLLTISMQQHQLKMSELTKATNEIKAQQKEMKGKSTQTVKARDSRDLGKTVLDPKG